MSKADLGKLNREPEHTKRQKLDQSPELSVKKTQRRQGSGKGEHGNKCIKCHKGKAMSSMVMVGAPQACQKVLSELILPDSASSPRVSVN